MAGANKLRKRFLNHRFKQHRRAVFIEQDELGIDTGFDRKLAKQTRAKAMNGSYDGAVQSAFVLEPAAALFVGRDAQHQVELAAQALAHFVRGAIGEGNCDDLIDREFVFAENVDVALDEDGRLARSRPRRHRDMLVDLVCSVSLFR